VQKKQAFEMMLVYGKTIGRARRLKSRGASPYHPILKNFFFCIFLLI